jgi:hypothetical protein
LALSERFMKPMEAQIAPATLNFSKVGMASGGGFEYAPVTASIPYQAIANTKWKKESIIGKWKPPAKTFLLTITIVTEEAMLSNA